MKVEGTMKLTVLSCLNSNLVGLLSRVARSCLVTSRDMCGYAGQFEERTVTSVWYCAPESTFQSRREQFSGEVVWEISNNSGDPQVPLPTAKACWK